MEERSIRISGVDMSFMELVVLFTKVGLAMIPALIIMGLVYMLLGWILATTLMPRMAESMMGM